MNWDTAEEVMVFIKVFVTLLVATVVICVSCCKCYEETCMDDVDEQQYYIG